MDVYISSKISHLKRMGLITGSHNGLGINGGACPTAIYEEQKLSKKERDRKLSPRSKKLPS